MKVVPALLLGLLCVTWIACACGRRSEPTPTERSDPSAQSSPSASGSSAAHRTRLPEWMFDPEDPARDYVGRYLRATMRYAAQTSCVVLGRSTFRGNDSVVEVRNPADASCGKPGDLRDTFLANVSLDRMRLDDPEHHAALKPWPDGSAPDGPSGTVAEVENLHSWKTQLHDVIKEQQLYPLRVQLYGRGTYPVITLAGWHALFDPKGDLSALEPAAQQLCIANSGNPVGFFARMDRQVLLRIDCPSHPHWDNLGL